MFKDCVNGNVGVFVCNADTGPKNPERSDALRNIVAVIAKAIDAKRYPTATSSMPFERRNPLKTTKSNPMPLQTIGRSRSALLTCRSFVLDLAVKKQRSGIGEEQDEDDEHKRKIGLAE